MGRGAKMKKENLYDEWIDGYEKRIGKKEYIKAWENHLDAFHTLRLTPSEELSKEVNDTINKLSNLIKKVADDKGLK